MPTVVSDSGPLRYLVLIEAVDVLPNLLGRVVIPPEVCDELDQPATPAEVRRWIATPPPWVAIVPAPPAPDGQDAALDRGERAAIALAHATDADLILIDDRAGVRSALAQGRSVLGTLGLLARAAQRGLVDLEVSFDRLRATNFRAPPAMLERLLAHERDRRNGTKRDL